MIPLEDAVAHVRERLCRLPVEEVPLDAALGLVAGADVRAPEPLPPFDNSAVDGFAVRAADVRAPGERLAVSADVFAGDAGDAPLAPGTAARIMTGAPVPPGADAVVMVEDCRVEGGPGDEVVELGRVPVPGQHVRPRGDDLDAGEVAVAAGTVLGPAHLGLLASVGAATVQAVRPPVVGVLSTGDELVGPGVPLPPGHIRDSNRLQLLAACRAAGFGTVDLGCAPDDEAAIEDALRRGVRACDAVLTSGGVSMGDADLVKVVLDRLGDMRWMQVAVRPAKPFAFGVVEDVPVFGLPGNPVSSAVSFELFARPALLEMAGHARTGRRRVPAVAPDGLRRRADGKVHFVRVVLGRDGDGPLEARSAGAQGSHQVSALAAADGLAVLPDGDGVPPGGHVEVLLLD